MPPGIPLMKGGSAPMNVRFATQLVISIFIASVFLLAIFPIILPPFVGPLVGTMLITLTHIVLGAFYCFPAHRDLRVGITALIGAASWATWAHSAWEEYSAQMTLPIINIAGMVAPIATLLVLLFLSITYLHLNEPSRTGKRYFVIGLAFIVLVLVEVLWTFLFQERLDSLSVSPETARAAMIVVSRIAPFVMAALALVTAMSTDSTKPRSLMVGAGGFALLSFFIPFVTVFSAVLSFTAWASLKPAQESKARN